MDPNYRFLAKATDRSRWKHRGYTSKILIEGLQIPPNELVLRHFVPLLEDKFKARAQSYYLLPLSVIGRLKLQIRFLRTITRNLSSALILQPKWGMARSKFLMQSQEAIREISTLRQLELLSYEGIVYGDLLYDEYLHDYAMHTIDLKDENLVNLNAEFILYLEFFLDYIDRVDVRAIVISHHVYKWGLLARIGISKEIPVFLVSSESVHKLSKDFQNPYDITKEYTSLLNQLPEKLVSEGVREARNRLEMRFAGEIGVDMPYAVGTAFTPAELDKHIIRKSRKIKVLVALHDFFDAPHVYGRNYYPDFYVWLERLGEISLETDYDWYIKLHPASKAESHELLRNFVRRYPALTVIPSDVSHLTIITGGIDFVLTVYGTIAIEYAHFGVAVINASANNPHNAFKFSITPTGREEYESYILDLASIKLNISREEIYQYYFMHNLHKLKSIFYRDYDNYLLSVGGYYKSITLKSIEVYLTDSLNRRSDYEVNQALVHFLGSDDKRLEVKHFY